MDNLNNLLSGKNNEKKVESLSIKPQKGEIRWGRVALVILSISALVYTAVQFLDNRENEQLRIKQEQERKVRTDIVERKEPSDGYHARARKSTEIDSAEKTQDLSILDRQMKKLQWGFKKSVEGTVAPSDAVNIYFKGSSSQLFFDLTFPYQGQIDKTFLEMYEKEGTSEYYVIFRLIWDEEGYLYFLGETDGDYLKLLESFGDFPVYKQPGLGAEVDGELTVNSNDNQTTEEENNQ